MKKQFLRLSAILLLAVTFQSCGKAAEEVKLEKYDLTITVPKLSVTPEYTDLKSSERDTDLSRYDFNVDNARINIIEVVESVFPTDIEMLKKAVSGSTDFIEVIETKQLTNGAFGIVYKMKGSNGEPIKFYNFYFKKGTRYFRMEPVFNNELKQLDLQEKAFESLK